MKRVLLINWDSYPHLASGGVYTWAKSLVDNTPDCEFVILNQLSNPNASAKLNLSPKVKKVIGLPIFGTNRYEEFYGVDGSFVSKIARTTNAVIQRQFLPLYEEFLNDVMTDEAEPQKLAKLVYDLHKFLVVYDAKKCFEYPQTWEIFLDRVTADPLYKQMKMREALYNYQVIQRSMQVLAVKLPKVDIVHSSLAWLPALVGVSAKMESGCSFIITEHGVAFRELVLYYNSFLYNEASKLFWTVFTRNIVHTIYESADLIIPVCKANQMWETQLGADPSKIRVVYNGVDTEKFSPVALQRADPRPTVVSVSRISVFKDIIDLIQAINYVRQTVGDVQCLLFGNSTEPEYYEMCVEMVKRLNLEENFRFMGSTSAPEKAYAMGDVVAFSSITEGFPFAVIEAMACGRAIVATDVGGVREAVDDSGLLVRSRSPVALANGILRLLRDPQLRSELEKKALVRARKEFSLSHSVQRYNEIYQELVDRQAAGQQQTNKPVQMVVG